MDRLISEQKVLDILRDYYRAWFLNDERFMEAVNKIKAIPSAEPCEDAISREDVIALVQCSEYELQDRVDNDAMCDDVRKLPSVNPQPKTDMLDKIRAEINDTGAYEQEVNGKTEFLKGVNYCLNIIDKYKAESEEV